MPIAAVPAYLRQADEQFYLEAPPGHRFTLYFPGWGWDGRRNIPTWAVEEVAQRRKVRRGQPDAWEDETVKNKTWACMVAAGKRPDESPDLRRHLVPRGDDGLKKWADLLRSLRERQAALATQTPSIFTLDAFAIGPFATGLGNEHPLENGFAFLNPYGLPYLAGSGVKGVLRRAAQELARGMWGDPKGWSEEPVYPLMEGEGERAKLVTDERTKQPIKLSVIDVLFGREPPQGDSNAVRGALAFWDVVPQIAGNSLMVEIMTPHQSHYYQIDKKKNPQPPHFQSPHDSGQPNPISFLTVPPGSGFTFHVVCDLAHLARLTKHKVESAPGLLADGPTHWKKLLNAAFEHAFEWLGFGAKTAVGYGAMERVPEEQLVASRAAHERARVRCEWVDVTIRELATKNNAKEEDTLRGRVLAEAWAALPDPELKARALADIRARWEEKGWWDNPPGGAAKKARAIYDAGSGTNG